MKLTSKDKWPHSLLIERILFVGNTVTVFDFSLVGKEAFGNLKIYFFQLLIQRRTTSGTFGEIKSNFLYFKNLKTLSTLEIKAPIKVLLLWLILLKRPHLKISKVKLMVITMQSKPA